MTLTNVDFGVEVTRAFESAGEVYATETPAGMVAVAVHVGAYDRIKETHDAIHAWCEASNRAFAGKSWEIYGRPRCPLWPYRRRVHPRPGFLTKSVCTGRITIGSCIG